jgi:hypothetical protein
MNLIYAVMIVSDHSDYIQTHSYILDPAKQALTDHTTINYYASQQPPDHSEKVHTVELLSRIINAAYSKFDLCPNLRMVHVLDTTSDWLKLLL